jgi:hypothetical protein
MENIKSPGGGGALATPKDSFSDTANPMIPECWRIYGEDRFFKIVQHITRIWSYVLRHARFSGGNHPIVACSVIFCWIRQV